MSCVVFVIKVTIDAHVEMIIHHAVELESMKGTDLLDSFIKMSVDDISVIVWT